VLLSSNSVLKGKLVRISSAFAAYLRDPCGDFAPLAIMAFLEVLDCKPFVVK
jgi:hypothetical protein